MITPEADNPESRWTLKPAGPHQFQWTPEGYTSGPTGDL
jgi:hypothetical protein